MRIVLASESPFRKRAMDLLGLAYETQASDIDEKAIRDDDPVELTRKLAEAKAVKVATEYPDAVVVSGDAVAAQRKQILKSRAASRKLRYSCDSYPEARFSL